MIDDETIERISLCVRVIDEKTDELLDIADVLEDHGVNVKLDDGSFLNPVSKMRSEADVIWDEVEGILASLGLARVFAKKEISE
jgi:hypothetical protein